MSVSSHLGELTANRSVLRFCEFVFRDVAWGRLPDYARIEFIRIPDLAPMCFAVDVRGGVEGGLPIKYSGTAIDDHFGRNVQGMRLAEVHPDPSRFLRVREMYRRCIVDRTACFRRRASRYNHRIVGSLDGVQDLFLIPCVNRDGDAVEFVVGIGSFMRNPPPGEECERIAYLGLGV